MILIVGFPYIRESYFATFRYCPDPSTIVFLLPKKWEIKNGKIVFHPPHDPNVHTAQAFFSHSHYPIIGGLLKGWMPEFPLVLWRMREEIELVYSCSEPNLLTTLYYAFWSKFFGKKHVVFSWENVPYWEKFHGINWVIKKAIIKATLRLSEGVICGNKKGSEIFRQLTHKPIAVIPMSGVDSERFHRKGNTKLFQGHDWTHNVVFTYAGAIGYRKGIHHIVEAFTQVVQKVPAAHLVIAGSGEYEKEIESAITASSVADHITRVPWLEHDTLPVLLEATDVFLYPSIASGGWEEQFGYSMVEASLMELPVIATRSGSIDEVVMDEKTGLLVSPDSVDELESAMVRLAHDRALRENLGRQGRIFALERFSHSVVAQKFALFFGRLTT